MFEPRQLANVIWALATLRDRQSALLPQLDKRILEVGVVHPLSPSCVLSLPFCLHLTRSVQHVGMHRQGFAFAEFTFSSSALSKVSEIILPTLPSRTGRHLQDQQQTLLTCNMCAHGKTSRLHHY